MQDLDGQVSARLRERRLLVGLTKQELAKILGVTYQQQHKYETGVNRISAGRLFAMAQALNVEVSYFFDGIDSTPLAASTRQQRLMFELVRNFTKAPSRKHQDAICRLARAMAQIGPEPAQAAGSTADSYPQLTSELRRATQAQAAGRRRGPAAGLPGRGRRLFVVPPDA